MRDILHRHQSPEGLFVADIDETKAEGAAMRVDVPGNCGCIEGAIDAYLAGTDSGDRSGVPGDRVENIGLGGVHQHRLDLHWRCVVMMIGAHEKRG